VNFMNYYSNAGLVISADGTKDDFWAATYFPNSISKDLWHYSYVNKVIIRDKHASGVLKVYIFNFGSLLVYIDDFRLSIRHLPPICNKVLSLHFDKHDVSHF